MTSPRERYLAAMGIEVFRLRDRGGTGDASSGLPGPAEAPGAPAEGPGAPAEAPGAPAEASRAPAEIGALDFAALEDTVSRCTRCGLHSSRTQTVFGVGRPDADLLVIGEAPGADEDRQGEPFVGRAGRLLNAMLGAIGLAREDVFIANILKCRPPGNRDPRPDEIATCAPYLERQIELVAPRAVLAVGRIAAQHLLQSDQPVGRLRGKIASIGPGQIPIVVTYHPAYLLRTPEAKAKTWQDLCLVRRLIRKEQ